MSSRSRTSPTRGTHTDPATDAAPAATVGASGCTNLEQVAVIVEAANHDNLMNSAFSRRRTLTTLQTLSTGPRFLRTCLDPYNPFSFERFSDVFGGPRDSLAIRLRVATQLKQQPTGVGRH